MLKLCLELFHIAGLFPVSQCFDDLHSITHYQRKTSTLPFYCEFKALISRSEWFHAHFYSNTQKWKLKDATAVSKRRRKWNYKSSLEERLTKWKWVKAAHEDACVCERICGWCGAYRCVKHPLPLAADNGFVTIWYSNYMHTGAVQGSVMRAAWPFMRLPSTTTTALHPTLHRSMFSREANEKAQFSLALYLSCISQ